ncbi:YqgE/AlgH family protein [Shumkonia mesophila]|uniref:YqgE/AlgH family protein n=1 Tax=Shumkonia mesophila TaxID=2838854 RepID=UPI002935076E|nr:YqgE/AlgH family protein [Shumkonia mesophila]
MAVLRSILALLAAAGILLAPPSGLFGTTPRAGALPYVVGQLLVAAPTMPDPRFARTVIYMVDHTAEGAFGLVVNRPLGAGPLDKLIKGFGIDPGQATGEVVLHYGGPVDSGGLFVLHSTDWKGPATPAALGPLAMTADTEVFRAIAEGGGPKRRLVLVGYAGWGPGQLEREMARKDWLTAPADPDLVFDDDVATKWERASALAGITL